MGGSAEYKYSTRADAETRHSRQTPCRWVVWVGGYHVLITRWTESASQRYTVLPFSRSELAPGARNAYLRVWARKLISLHTHVEGHTAASAPREGRWRVDGTSPPPTIGAVCAHLRPSAAYPPWRCKVHATAADLYPHRTLMNALAWGYRHAGDGPALHRPRSDGYQARRIGSPTVCKSHCPWEPSSTIALWVPLGDCRPLSRTRPACHVREVLGPPRARGGEARYPPVQSLLVGTSVGREGSSRGGVSPRGASHDSCCTVAPGTVDTLLLGSLDCLVDIALPGSLAQQILSNV